MSDVSLVGPADGEVIQLGPIHMRILEDGRTTQHRLGLGEITLAPHTEGPPQHRHAAPHTFANPSDQTTVLLNTFTPDLYVQYFRDLRDMIARGQQLTPEATIQVMNRYATVPSTEFASPALLPLDTPASMPLETP